MQNRDTYSSHPHKDFACRNCGEWLSIRDESKYNVCFICRIAGICDKCFEKSHLKKHVKIG